MARGERRARGGALAAAGTPARAVELLRRDEGDLAGVKGDGLRAGQEVGWADFDTPLATVSRAVGDEDGVAVVAGRGGGL